MELLKASANNDDDVKLCKLCMFRNYSSLATFLSLIVKVHSDIMPSGVPSGNRTANAISRSRSSQVDDFGTNRKRICDFLLVIHSNLGPTVHHFWDTTTYWLKITIFSYPLSFGAPLRMFPLEVRGNFTAMKLESWGYPPVKTAWS